MGWFEDVAQMLDGITAAELKRQYEALPPVESVAERLGAQGNVLPPAQYTPFRNGASTIEWSEFRDGDHYLSLCWPEAAELAARWLVSHLGQ